MYVVYQHRRKDNGEVFYVGQGTLKRAYEGIYNRRNENWIKIVNESGGFEVDILVENLTRDESLLIESQYIKKYGTKKHGTGILVNERLSGTRGVESGYKHTESKIEEISKKTQEGMIKSEAGKKVSNALKKYFGNDEIRKNLKCNVKVDQYEINGKYIKTWNSMLEVQRELKIWATNISNTCRGLQKSAGGYKWSYTK